MPIISQFYGIVVTMNDELKGKHHTPHIHIRYNNYKVVYDFNCNIIEGRIPYKQKKMIEAWIVIHKEELITLWNVIQEGKEYFKIEPLK